MVLVCHPHRFVFLKTRKTASTSVEMYLERYCVPDGHPHGSEAVHETVTSVGIVGSRREGRTDRDQWRNHLSAAKVRKLLGAGRFDSYAKVTTVRNPWARMLSQFLWQKQLGYPTSEQEFDAIRVGLARFLDDVPIRDDWEIVSIDDRIVVDEFVRFEALDDDMARVCARLGLPWEAGGLGDAKRRSGKRATYALSDYYSSGSAERIARAFQWLLARFDYSLTHPDRAPTPFSPHDRKVTP